MIIANGRGSETGFFPTKIIAETRFIGLGAGTQKPGFFLNLGEYAKIIAETRFLELGAGVQKLDIFRLHRIPNNQLNRRRIVSITRIVHLRAVRNSNQCVHFGSQINCASRIGDAVNNF